VTELFPVSSLGHSVIIPALIGGRWAKDLNVSAPESPYLAFIVGLHVATAIALLIFFRKEWVRIVGGFLTSIRDRRVQTPDQKLAWLLILATVPVGVTGLLLEHTFRTVLGKPIPAALFLAANGVVLYAGELLRRRAPVRPATADGEQLPRMWPPTSVWPSSAGARASSSAPPRSSPCSPASAAPAPPWSPG